jgi:hypothetical protein
MRESQYVEPYLSANARRGPLRGFTISTYLARVLRGRARGYGASYEDALRLAIVRRVDAGQVIALPSAGGGTAYHRVADLAWPISVPALKLRRAYDAPQSEPAAIDCAFHGRRHALSWSGNAELRVRESDVAALTAFLARLRPDALHAASVTLASPEDIPAALSRPLSQLLLDIARLLADAPDRSVPDSLLRDLLDNDSHRCGAGLAAALLHARDCLHADAIIRAVETEIVATGRVAYALRSAADPAWVTLRALEAAP